MFVTLSYSFATSPGKPPLFGQRSAVNVEGKSLEIWSALVRSGIFIQFHSDALGSTMCLQMTLCYSDPDPD